MRDHTSFPTWSVPSGWPGEKSGRLASRMLPPVGLPTGPTSGHTKQRKKITAIMAPGIQTPASVRQRPRAAGPAGIGSNAPATLATSAAGVAISDPWIECRVEEVCEQVGHDDHSRERE